MNKEILFNNKNKIHTTIMGEMRIKRNLNIDGDVVSFCISKLEDVSSEVTRTGKNYYVEINDIIITINAYSYTIITAHKKKISKKIKKIKNLVVKIIFFLY